MFWNCCTGQSFPRKLGAFDLLGIEERLPSQEGRSVVIGSKKSIASHTFAKTEGWLSSRFGISLRIAHRSSLRERSVVRYPRCWIDASYRFSFNQGLWSIPVSSIAEDNLVLSLDFVGLWPWLIGKVWR